MKHEEEIIIGDGDVLSMPVKMMHQEFMNVIQENREIKDAGGVAGFLAYHLIHHVREGSEKSLHKLADIVGVGNIPPIITIKKMINHPELGADYDNL